MNYYYDVILNFKTENLYKFYEWEAKDEYSYYQKIPLYKIDEKSLIKIINYQGSFSKSFFEQIKNKSSLRNNKINTSVIFTDMKFCVALLLDDGGNIINKSNLLIEDELNIIEIAYSLKKTKIDFNPTSKSIFLSTFRQEQKIKEEILKKITKIYLAKENSKLTYYYLEWFNEYEKNPAKIYQRIKKTLESDNPYNLNKIYNILKVHN